MLKLQTPNGDTRILLHSCCAPCSSAIIECMLANGLRPTVFYCNPNIYPQAEYETRKNEAIRFVTAQGLDFVDADYDYAHWKARMTGLEDEPERGPRCLLLHPAPDGDRPLCLGTRFHAVHHHPRLVALEESGANQRGRTTRRRPLPRHPVLGTELAERRTTGAAQPAAPRICVLQPTVLRLRIQHEAPRQAERRLTAPHRDSVLHTAGSFRASRFRPARCRKLSRFAISSCTLQEAFPLRDSVLHAAGSFRTSRFRPARCRKLSHFAIPSCTLRQAFASRENAAHHL